MKIKYLVLILLISIAFSAKAQVTIGDITKPHSFSALEIANIGKGLRLPQLTTSQRDILTTVIESDDEIDLAQGLVIYNRTNKRIEMWQDDTEKWISLPSKNRCIAAQNIAITAISALILDEYGGEDLELEATTTGSSANADLFFEWYKDDVQVGTGKVYKVAKEKLSFRDAGVYTVKVISCSNTVSAETKFSAPVSITINEN